ncbi:hypothetical protein D3C72_2011810 [compost metagenome]
MGELRFECFDDLTQDEVALVDQLAQTFYVLRLRCAKGLPQANVRDLHAMTPAEAPIAFSHSTLRYCGA